MFLSSLAESGRRIYSYLAGGSINFRDHSLLDSGSSPEKFAGPPVEGVDDAGLARDRDRLSEATNSQPIQAVDTVPAVARSKTRGPWRTVTATAIVSLAAGLLIAAWLAPPPQPDLANYNFTPIARNEATEALSEWSPDGKSLAYQRIVHGIWQIFTVANGSDAQQMTHADKDCSFPFWSPDGATVYYTSDNATWAIPVSGGTSEKVFKAAYIAMRPDGNTFLYATGVNARIASLKGGKPEEAWWWHAPAGFIAKRPGRFSPDGSKVLVLSGDKLWTIPFRKGTPLTFPIALNSSAAWMPDSRRVLISEVGAGSNSTMSILDTANGNRHLIYSTQQTIVDQAVSPDGRHIAYTTGEIEWDVLELNPATGASHTLSGASGGITWFPDWHPSGAHYMVSSDRGGVGLDDVSSSAFSHRLARAPAGHLIYASRWSPDGSRFVYYSTGPEGPALMLSNSSGAHAIKLLALGPFTPVLSSWSPDGQWVTAIVNRVEKQQFIAQLVKIRPQAGAIPVVLPMAAPVTQVGGDYRAAEWSPAGDWILYPSRNGMSLTSSDGLSNRRLTAREFAAYTFSKDGRQVFGLYHNAAGEGAEWQIYSVDVNNGAEKMIASVELPPTTRGVAGFSLHPDGKRLLTSIAKWPYDIWMLEGFDQPSRTWLKRLLRP